MTWGWLTWKFEVLTETYRGPFDYDKMKALLFAFGLSQGTMHNEGKEDMHACKSSAKVESKPDNNKKIKRSLCFLFPFPRLLSTHFKFSHPAKEAKQLSYI